jgi:hypothetical protein
MSKPNVVMVKQSTAANLLQDLTQAVRDLSQVALSFHPPLSDERENVESAMSRAYVSIGGLSYLLDIRVKGIQTQ